MSKKVDSEVKLDFYNRPILEFEPIEYDDIVDRSNFQPSSEMKRNMRISGTSPGGTNRPLYDFGDKSTNRTDFLSDVEIALRDGKLDKADVQKLKALAEEYGAAKVDEAISESESEKEKARSSRMDELLGVNSDTSS